MTAFYDALQSFFIPWRRKKMREEILRTVELRAALAASG